MQTRHTSDTTRRNARRARCRSVIIYSSTNQDCNQKSSQRLGLAL